MKTIKNQKGVGMIEVLVALVLLSIGVLGFTALQLRAVDATTEANTRIQAMNLARDLAERIRTNRGAMNTYITAINSNTKAAGTNCFTSACTTIQMATFDSVAVNNKASDLGLSLQMPVCQGVNNGRRCIYVAWGSTTPTNGANSPNCTNGSVYVVNSQCLVVESY